jgi:hypothetical protein
LLLRKGDDYILNTLTHLQKSIPSWIFLNVIARQNACVKRTAITEEKAIAIDFGFDDMKCLIGRV